MDKLQQWKQQMLEKKKLEKQEGNLELLPVPSLEQSGLPAINFLEENKLSLSQGSNEQKQQKNQQLQIRGSKSDDIRRKQSEAKEAEVMATRFISQAIPHNEGMGTQKKMEVKLTRYVLKDIDKLKLAISNMDACMKGIQCIRKRMKTDKELYRIIKHRLDILRA